MISCLARAVVRTAVIGLLAIVTAVPAGAQVIRGRITEANSAAPVGGVLVSLLTDWSDDAVVSVLTSATGEYAIRAPGAGRYRLAAKRIGVRRFVSTPFALGDGETRQLDIVVDAIAMSLPEVTVSGLCVTNPRDVARVASLWDEVRTALAATTISQRDRLARASIVRYAAELDPGSLRPLFEWRSDAEVLTERPFTSRSGDSLSLTGYWRVLPGDSVEFQAPDAAALASDAFVRDHCFRPGRGSRDRPGQVAVEFEPSRDRELADIQGTIWIDETTFELRVVEFRYTRLPRTNDARFIGGEVHFSRLASGAWIVDRWFIRMPQEVVRSDDWPRRQLREEGGVVVADGATASATTASVTGVVRDSSGNPVPGALVRALGHAQEVRTGPEGAYRLDDLTPGDVSLLVRTAGYDAHGVLAGARRFSVRAGQVRRVDFTAPRGSALIGEFCADRRAATYRAVIRLMVVDSASRAPLPGVTLRASWHAPPYPGFPARDGELRVRTDARGAVSFCYLPPNATVTVSLVTGYLDLLPLVTVETIPNGLDARVVTVRR